MSEDVHDEARVHWNKNWLASKGKLENHPNAIVVALQNRVAELDRERAQLLRHLERRCLELSERIGWERAYEELMKVLELMDELEGKDANV